MRPLPYRDCKIDCSQLIAHLELLLLTETSGICSSAILAEPPGSPSLPHGLVLYISTWILLTARADINCMQGNADLVWYSSSFEPQPKCFLSASFHSRLSKWVNKRSTNLTNVLMIAGASCIGREQNSQWVSSNYSNEEKAIKERMCMFGDTCFPRKCIVNRNRNTGSDLKLSRHYFSIICTDR